MTAKRCPYCNCETVTVAGEEKCLCCGGLRPDYPKPEEDPAREQRVFEKSAALVERFQKDLLNNVDGSLDYLKNSRRLTDPIIKDWHLGYCSANNYGLQDLYGYTLGQMFQKRIIFPIIRPDGNVMGFGGRKFLPDDESSQKYLNSPNNGVYDKGCSLYGLNVLPSGSVSRIFLCEGYMDAITMDRFGYAYPVASLGTALTHNQALLLRSRTDNVTICYDSDQPGTIATLRAVDVLWKAGFRTENISVLKAVDDKDVDEALRTGGQIRRYTLGQYLVEQKAYGLYVESFLHLKGGQD